MATINKAAAEKMRGVAELLKNDPDWLWKHYAVRTSDFKTWLSGTSGRGISKLLTKSESVEDAAHKLAARMTGKDKPDKLEDLAELF